MGTILPHAAHDADVPGRSLRARRSWSGSPRAPRALQLAPLLADGGRGAWGFRAGHESSVTGEMLPKIWVATSNVLDREIPTSGLRPRQ